MEMKLKFLNGQLLSLASIEPHNVKHSNDVTPIEIEKPFDWNKVIKSIN
jgi:hypothetical protein